MWVITLEESQTVNPAVVRGGSKKCPRFEKVKLAHFFPPFWSKLIGRCVRKSQIWVWGLWGGLEKGEILAGVGTGVVFVATPSRNNAHTMYRLLLLLGPRESLPRRGSFGFHFFFFSFFFSRQPSVQSRHLPTSNAYLERRARLKRNNTKEKTLPFAYISHLASLVHTRSARKV